MQGGTPITYLTVPGAAAYTKAFPEKGICSTALCDGPAGLLLQRVSALTKKGRIKMMEMMMDFGVEPSRIFINIGTNDISMFPGTFEENLNHMLANYRDILTQIKTRLPDTSVYLMAYYPVNENAHGDDAPEYMKYMFINRSNKNIPTANAEVEKLAKEFGYHYIGEYEEILIGGNDYLVVHHRVVVLETYGFAEVAENGDEIWGALAGSMIQAAAYPSSAVGIGQMEFLIDISLPLW